MKAIDINTFFLGKADWVDRDKTCDRIIIGDADKPVERVLVTWMPSFEAIRHAVQGKYDMLLVHEPTFYAHYDKPDDQGSSPITRAKRDYIREHGLVVLRNHDVWDRLPGAGIPWSWARFLQLGDEPVALGLGGAQHRYDIEPVTLQALAERIAERTATIGEPVVRMIGDPERKVGKIGVGTGCICSVDAFMELGCDVSIVCDDGSPYWSRLQPAIDADHPAIRVHHGTSEEPGMVSMTDYVNTHLPGVTATHLPYRTPARFVAHSP